jgi:FSR family fosmidomycin resistance protein-like MFS transporter
MAHQVKRRGWVAGTEMAVLLALAHGVSDGVTAILATLLPTIQSKFAASATTLAILVATITISASVTQPLLGAVAERIGPRRMLAAGVAVTAVAFSLLGVARSVPQLLLLLVVGGLGSAALHPAGTTIVGGPSVRNPGMAVGLFTAGGMTGAAVGPIVVLYLVSSYGADSLLWLMVPGLVLAVLLLLALPEWEPHCAALKALFSREILSRRILVLTAVTSMVDLAFLTFLSAVPLWLVGEHGIDRDAPLLGAVLAVFALASGAGAVAGGIAGPRVGQARAAAVSMWLALLPLAAVFVVPAGSGTLVAAALGGVLIYASQPLLVVAAQQAAPAAPAAAAGLVLGLGNAVAALGYIASGMLQDAVGLPAAMLASFALLLPAGLVARRAI